MANPVAYNFKAIRDYVELGTFKKVAQKYGLSTQMVCVYFRRQCRVLYKHGLISFDPWINAKPDNYYLLAIEQYETKKKEEEELVEKANNFHWSINRFDGVTIDTKLYLSVIELNKLVQTL